MNRYEVVDFFFRLQQLAEYLVSLPALLSDYCSLLRKSNQFKLMIFKYRFVIEKFVIDK